MNVSDIDSNEFKTIKAVFFCHKYTNIVIVNNNIIFTLPNENFGSCYIYYKFLYLF